MVPGKRSKGRGGIPPFTGMSLVVGWILNSATALREEGQLRGAHLERKKQGLQVVSTEDRSARCDGLEAVRALCVVLERRFWLRNANSARARSSIGPGENDRRRD